MASSLNFKFTPHKGRKLGMELPIKFTWAELVTIQGTTPATMDDISMHIDSFTAAFQGGSKIQDSNFASWSIGFGTPITAAIPTIQTHEERVVMTWECQFPSSVTELHKYSLPNPDLLVDWIFPSGQDRVYAADVAANFSAGVENFLAAMQEYLLAFGYDGVTAVTLLYVDLVGSNS